MLETSTTTHGAVSPADQHGVDGGDEYQMVGTEVTETRLALYKPPQEVVEAPTFAVTYFWDRIVDNDCMLNDEYIFSNTEVSPRTMTHVFKAYTQTRNEAFLEEDDQGRVTQDIYQMLHSSNLLQDEALPVISFYDRKIFLTCPNTHMLMESYKLLKAKNPLASCRLFYLRKGFPFRAQFWRLHLPFGESDENHLKEDLKLYIAKHEKRLGKTHAAWAKFYKLSGLEGRRIFKGDLVLLTEEGSLSYSRDAPEFRGTKPKLSRFAS